VIHQLTGLPIFVGLKGGQATRIVHSLGGFSVHDNDMLNEYVKMYTKECNQNVGLDFLRLARAKSEQA
jgi:hypothetical protein